jgi:potassium-transporting ATPase KdpC subunit
MQIMILKQLRIAIITTALFTILTGLAYPLVVTGLGQLMFPARANGSLVTQNGKLVGSELIGQPFSDPKYFWGRPSATSPFPYNAAASSGSNYGPTNPALFDAVKGRIKQLRDADSANTQPIPVDLVTASGSGLDPDISVAAAQYQIARVARVRGLGMDKVQSLVEENTESRQLGFLGEPRVNVLRLNLALDAAQPKTEATKP